MIDEETLNHIFAKYPWFLNHDLVPWHGAAVESNDLEKIYTIFNSFEYIKLDKYYESFHPRLKIYILNKILRKSVGKLTVKVSGPYISYSILQKNLLKLEVQYLQYLQEIPEKYHSVQDKRKIKEIILKKLTF